MKVVIALLAVYIVATSAFSDFSPWVNIPEDLSVEDENTPRPPCGVSKAIYDVNKLVGGHTALLGEFPWQVSLRRRSWSGKYIHVCGGAVIGGPYILTAAHCVVDGGSASQYQVLVGVNILNYPSRNHVAYNVSKFIVHERYDSVSIDNDIAILVLSKSVKTASSNGIVNSVCLPRPGSEPTGTVTATGWPITGRFSPDTNYFLQAVKFPVVSKSQCRSLYGSLSIADSMLCAGVSSGGKEYCQADSGGPVTQRVNGKGFLVGIVAWGYGCFRPGYPGVYTQVSRFIDWIQINTPGRLH